MSNYIYEMYNQNLVLFLKIKRLFRYRLKNHGVNYIPSCVKRSIDKRISTLGFPFARKVYTAYLR